MRPTRGDAGTHPLRAVRLRRYLSRHKVAMATGLSRETLRRAENGARLNLDTIKILCDFFGQSAEALGLAARGGDRQEAQIGRAAYVGDNDEVRRRDLLGFLNVAGAALVWPSGLDVDWGRLQGVVADAAALDDAVLRDCATLNLSAWQAFRSASRKGIVLDAAVAQMRRLTRLLSTPRTSAQERQLRLLIVDLAQLCGEIFFDANQYADAVSCYTFAAGVARDAEAYDLWASTLVRQSFIPIYDRQYEQAIPLLDAAAQLARRGDTSLATRHWAAAVSAGAYAGVGDLSSCQRALAQAEEVQGLKDGSNGTWLRFDGSRLAEERGACYVRLGRPELAEPSLQVALSQLPTPTRRRGLVLTDLALAALQARDIERACEYGHEVIALAHQCSGVLVKSLEALGVQFDSVKDHPAAKSLKDEIRQFV